MCHPIEGDNGVREALAQASAAEARFNAAVSGLRVEAPKVYAALQPALAAASEWLSASGLALARIDVRERMHQAARQS